MLYCPSPHDAGLEARCAWDDDRVALPGVVGLARSSPPIVPVNQVRVQRLAGARQTVSNDGILEDHLAVTDGTRTWEPDALEAVTSATEQDPTWLQHRAAINSLFSQESK
jgi:hypothetical protein